MKKSMFDKKQKGFTLLELLVVITLLAILSVGALVAYEGIGDNAQATAAANNTSGADRAIRNFRAVTQNYPNQWDSLVTSTGTTPAFLADETTAKFVSLPLAVTGATGDFRNLLDEAFESVGIDELQERVAAATTVGVEPNLQHNEGAVGADAAEVNFDTVTNFAILPTFGGAACSVDGDAIPTTKMDGTTAVDATDGARQNVINDALESDQCNLVIALGFGHDAAHSTSGSSVAISTAPTFVSKDINPNTEYARYIALFHAGADANADDDIVDTELFAKPRLLAIVDTQGNMIDENIAAQNPAN
jgi:prepilin-type N-terminal cleavage/methylation domain-containing protein